MTDTAHTPLPTFFTEMLAHDYDAADEERIIAGLSTTRPTTLRANTLRATREEVADALAASGFAPESVSWFADAFVLRSAGEANLWDTEVLKLGKIYVQSLSSMLPPLFMELEAGADVLDMCAAPGGKTCEIAALGAGRLHITACEQSAVRADKLEYNLRKQGAENVVVLRQDARKLDSFFSFDAVLLDAPCSGSGTLHVDDPKLGKRFSAALVKDSCKKQAALIAKALEIVKPGGMLVYSTCSVLKCENEEIVRAALARANKRGSYKIEPIEAARIEGAPLLPSSIDGALTVCPSELYEGFFMAKIRRYA